MTLPAESQHRFTLHPSVAQCWWLRHLPDAGFSAQFLDQQVITGSVHLVAPDILEFDLLNAIVSDLVEALDSGLVQQVAIDVRNTLILVQRIGRLRLTAHGPLLRPAVIIASLHRIPLIDAIAMALAQNSGWPLLVGDRAVYERLHGLVPLEPPLDVVWLPVQMQG